jgi:hypothetical protein
VHDGGDVRARCQPPQQQGGSFPGGRSLPVSCLQPPWILNEAALQVNGAAWLSCLPGVQAHGAIAVLLVTPSNIANAS